MGLWYTMHVSAGFMNESGPEEDIYAGKTTDELITLLSTRSDHWYNLARAFPKLYTAGFDRGGIEEITNVDPARQNVWSTAAEVFHSLKVRSSSSLGRMSLTKRLSRAPCHITERCRQN
jgi:Rubisco accumulation factor 1 helix turn helix domain